MTAVTEPPGSTVSIWRPAYGPSTPWKYHHGMPFWAAITAVSSCMRGLSRSPLVAYEFAFRPRNTKSTGPISAGSSVAGGRASKSPRSERTLTPFSRIAFRLAPRATRWTSVPPRDRAAPTYAPMAPAPRTATLMRRHGTHKWEAMHSPMYGHTNLCVTPWDVASLEPARGQRSSRRPLLQPSGPAEAAVENAAYQQDHEQHGRIAVARRE